MTIITENKIQIAKENDLEIVGQPVNEHEGNIKYLYYRFIKCGHHQNIDTNLVKRKLFKCRQCEQERLENTAKEQGLELLERAHKGTPGLYKFIDCGHTQRIGYDAVSRGLFRCRECYYADETVDSRREMQANKQGLEFVGKTEDHAVGVYKRLKCGHTFNYQYSAIVSANKGKYQVGCVACYDDNISEILNRDGATLIKRKPNKAEYKYSCGHTNTQGIHQIKKRGILPCQICKRQSVIDKAKEKGLIPLSDKSVNSLGNGTYLFEKCFHKISLNNRNIVENKEIRCKKCNHDGIVEYLKSYNVSVSEIVPVNGRNRFVGVFDACGHSRVFDPAFLSKRPEGSKLVCTSCRDMKHQMESEKHGLTIIGEAENGNPNYRSFRMPCCGSLQDMELTHVRRNRFVCRTCEQTKYHKPTSVYLFKIETDSRSWLKLGLALNVDYRVTQYGLPDDAKTSLIYSKEFVDGYTAITIEKAIHKHFKNKRISPKEMKDMHTKSGFTECYPLEVENDILSKIKDEEWQNKL